MSINKREMKESISKTSLPKTTILPKARPEMEIRSRFMSERRAESSNWSAAPENEERLEEDKHEAEESIEENGEQVESENMIHPELGETYSNSPHVEENNEIEMSELVGSEDEDDYTNEKEVVLDLIYALKGMNTRYLRRANNDYFQVDLKITNRNIQIVNKICTLVKMYNRIREVELGSSTLMNSVKQGISEEMEDFNKLLDSLIENYDEYRVSLLQLYTLLHKPYRKVKLLYKLVSGKGHIIHNLYEYSTRGDGMSRETFTRLLRKGLVPYFETVFKWLCSGELPEQEYFFVTTEPENGEKRTNSLPYSAGNYGNSTADTNTRKDHGTSDTTTRKGNSRKRMNRESEAVSDDKSKNKEVYENLYFNATKVFKFFPMDLAEDIYEQGKLSHCLKRLNRSVNTITLNSFMLEVLGNEKCLEESLTSLRRLVSELDNSRQLARAMLEKDGLGEYVSALCIQFTDPDHHQRHQYKYGRQHQYRHNHKSLKDDYDMTETVENGVRVYYPNPKFPYNLVIDDYRVYKGMIRVSAMLSAAANSLNESYAEYIWLNRCNNRVLELSKVLNKLNFYRSEMNNFLSSVQPYHNSLYWLSVYRASLCSHHTLRSLRESSRSFTQNLDYRFYSELPPILLNVIEFGKSMSELLRQDVRQLHSLNLRGSANLVHFIDNDMADFASKSLRTAEQFRIDVLGLLNRFKGRSLQLDFNDFYKFNTKII